MPAVLDGQNHGMAITHAFAGVPVTEYSAAHDWYVRLLGREADMFPHDSECVWQLTSTSSIYVVQDPQRAGRSLVALALDDLDAHERRMRSAGFIVTVETTDAAPRRLVVTDADGNRLTFFQDPSAA
jgi:catechol 2,3-dioxygenase-like lactoylglutathione lyase family enzyme